MADTAPTIDRPRRRGRAETTAWFYLVAFFLIFCAIVAGLCAAGWRYYTTAMVPLGGTVVRVHVPTGVSYQQKGSSRRDTPVKPCETPPKTDTCQTLAEDDRVIAVPQAGYGPVASVTLPDSAQIDLYSFPSGVELMLKTYRVSRWTMGRREVRFVQTAGYARYDIPSKEIQQYAEVSYVVEIGGGLSVALQDGGSYSIDIPKRDPDRPLRVTASGAQLQAEIAVRAGAAELQGGSGAVRILPNQKIQVGPNSAIGEPLPAEWDLIRDGNFKRYAAGAYPKGLEDWVVRPFLFDRSATKEEQNGQVKIYTGCPPDTPSFCSDNPAYLAQFQRQGNQSKSFGVGIEQATDLDISEYRALRFTMWARVIRQSISNAGIANIECPVTVKILFKQSSPTDPEQERYICFYRNSTGELIPPSSPFVYQAVDDLPSWYRITFDLRDEKLDLLRSARYIQSIAIYGNGHDYISEVTDISLIATQTR
jgi:hypothetical protein